MKLSDLAHCPPTLAEIEAERRGKPLAKPASRLQQQKAAKQLAVVDEREFKRQVWHRDRSKCRRCARKVIKAMERVPERGEVHHLHGRLGDLRYEVKGALLLCLECHEQVTGRVNLRLFIVPTTGSKEFRLQDGRVFLSAEGPLKFVRTV